MEENTPNANQNKLGGAILISNRADFNAGKGIRDKKGRYIIKNDQWINPPKDITILACMHLTKEYQTT